MRAARVWPMQGTPANPEAWLSLVARRFALDHLRRSTLLPLSEEVVGSFSASEDDEIRMLFLCCHPSLSLESQIALTLKTLCGLGVGEVARALLSTEEAVAQRLVRAKRALAETSASFDVEAGELAGRLDSVLLVLYLLFNEGYTSFDESQDLDRCDEAILLANLLAEHPFGDDPSVHALLALMLFQSSRRPARLSSSGELRLLEEQDRSLWDRGRIALGFMHLDLSARGLRVTNYHCEAAIASCHAAAERYEDTDWGMVLEQYDLLYSIAPSPVVALNRAVALSKVSGAAVGLEAVDAVAGHPSLRRYYLLPAIRGSLLAELGRAEEAVASYRSALELVRSEPEAALLRRRIEGVGG